MSVIGLLLLYAMSGRQLPQFEVIPCPPAPGLALTGRMVQDGDRETMVSSIAYGDHMHILETSLPSGSTRTHDSDEGGAWAMTVAKDGSIYLGSYPHAHLLHLSLRTHDLEDLGPVLPGEEIIWQLSTAPDGSIYGGTKPGGKLFRFDPAARSIHEIGRVNTLADHVIMVCAAPDGYVYLGLGSNPAMVVAFQVATESFKVLLTGGPGFGNVYEGEDGAVYGSVGTPMRLRDGAAIPTEHPSPPKSFLVDRSGKDWRLKSAIPRQMLDLPLTVKAGRQSTTFGRGPKSEYAGAPLPIFRVGKGPDHRIYMSSAMPATMLRFDPKTARSEVIGRLAGGEGYEIVPFGKSVAIGVYDEAKLFLFDPSKPFSAHNPADQGTIKKGQSRPYGFAIARNGSLWAAMSPAPGLPTGAVASVAEGGRTIESFPWPFPGESPTSLAQVTDRDWLFGYQSTENARLGGLAICDFNTGNATKFGEDVSLESVTSLVPAGDGVFLGSDGKKIVAIDAANRTIPWSIDCPYGRIPRGGLIRSDSGRVFGFAGRNAFEVVFTNGHCDLEPIATSDQDVTAAGVELDGYLYAASGSNLLRVAIPKTAHR